MYRVAEIRRARVSGRMDNHYRQVGNHWVARVQDHDFAVSIEADKAGTDVTFKDGTTLRVVSDWLPGQSLAHLMVGDRAVVLKVNKITNGFRIRSRGADMPVKIMSPRQAELADLMPVKTAPDTSKFLLCPMPGLVVSVNVAEGEEVQEGQALCTVEAMKMENILRAEKKGVVAKINATAGDSLKVDEIIMTFE